MRVHALIVDATPEEKERLKSALAGVELDPRDLEGFDWFREGQILFLEGQNGGSPSPRPLFVRREGRLLPIRPDEIHRVEAYGDYVHLHAGDHAYLVHMNLKQMRSRLDSDRFLQIHRSHIVNLDHVVALRSHDDRRFRVTLTDGSEVVASRAGSLQLKSMMA